MERRTMCGIFGFASNGSGEVDPKFLERIARDTERRGPHAFGFAWIDGQNRLRMFKQAGKISDYLGVLRMARDARMLIGDCRWATHGDPRNNLNNHPHPCDGGWLVHNGVIGGHESINEEHGLAPVTNCDSETLALMVETLPGTLVERVAGAVDECATSSLAMMALWRSPSRMIVARDGNPVHLAEFDEGWYLASNRSAMPECWPVEDKSLLSFTVRNGQTTLEQYDIDQVCEAR
jgi:glucosamine 6-phosphate synthetase-like amidotransferase/phosphosugar isomerase protein